jgi:uncharacterized protein (TIGR02145 family)
MILNSKQMKNPSSLESFIPSSLHSLIPFFLFLLIPSFLIAQVPQGIPYQAVIRDNAGAPLVNTPILVRFTLHQNTTDGAIEYQETQSATTNAFGVINTQFGTGTPTQGTFASIVWSNTSKFIQVEANDGNGYVDMGTQQMMSVPYAMYAGSAGNSLLPAAIDSGSMLIWDGDQWTILDPTLENTSMFICDGQPQWGPCPIDWMTPQIIINSFDSIIFNGGIESLNGNVISSVGLNYSDSNDPNTVISSSISLAGNSISSEINNLLPGHNYSAYISVLSYNGGSFYSDTINFSVPDLSGCLDSSAFNFNPIANIEGECIAKIYGCTNSSACNFNSAVNIENGSCVFSGQICDDANESTVTDMINNQCICNGVESVLYHFNVQSNNSEFVYLTGATFQCNTCNYFYQIEQEMLPDGTGHFSTSIQLPKGYSFAYTYYSYDSEENLIIGDCFNHDWDIYTPSYWRTIDVFNSDSIIYNCFGQCGNPCSENVLVTFRLNADSLSSLAGANQAECYISPISHFSNNYQAWIMSDFNNDGILERTVELPPYSEIQYQFTNDWINPNNNCINNERRTLITSNENIILPIICPGQCVNCGESIAEASISFSVDVNNILNVNTVGIAGDFNNWCSNCNSLTDDDSDGIWTGTLNLPPGNYEYLFVVNDTIQEDISQLNCSINSHRTINVDFNNATISTICFEQCVPCPFYTNIISGNGVTDIDGNYYSTIVIGGSEFMSSNLKTARFNNGDFISTDGNQISMYKINPNYLSLQNQIGYYYNGYSVTENRNICPTGWHVPSESEYVNLISNIGSVTMAGGSLKSKSYWEFPNKGATNAAFFNGFPSGYYADNTLTSYSNQALFWTSSNFDNSFGIARYLQNTTTSFISTSLSKDTFCSVRCKKD